MPKQDTFDVQAMEWRTEVVNALLVTEEKVRVCEIEFDLAAMYLAEARQELDQARAVYLDAFPP